MSARDEVTVLPLSERELPWSARIWLRRAKKLQQTGILLSAIIRTPIRSMTRKAPVVSVYDGKQHLCTCSPTSKVPKFAWLEPGVHTLRFQNTRFVAGSSFTRSVTLQPGDVVVALCEPIQPWVFYAKSPSANLWYIGVDEAQAEDVIPKY